MGEPAGDTDQRTFGTRVMFTVAVEAPGGTTTTLVTIFANQAVCEHAKRGELLQAQMIVTVAETASSKDAAMESNHLREFMVVV